MFSLYDTDVIAKLRRDAGFREDEVCGRWQFLVHGGALPAEVGMTTAVARK